MYLEICFFNGLNFLGQNIINIFIGLNKMPRGKQRNKWNLKPKSPLKGFHNRNM